jgi:hypothetical protein
MNKKGQVTSVIFFFVLAIAILIVSIVVLRMTNSILTPFQNQIGNMSTQAGTAVAGVHSAMTNWWDIMIIALLGINIVILLVSAFMVDIHPAFLIVYIIAVFFMFIMGNYALSALDGIWGGMATATELAQTPMQQWIINNFNFVMLGIILLSGIVMYAKFKFFAGQGAGGNA